MVFNEHGIADMTRAVGETRSIEYLRLTRKTAITLDLTGLRVGIPQSGRCELYLATTVEFSGHRVVDVTLTVAETCPIEYLRPYRKTAITLDLTGLRVDIPQTG